MTNPYQPPGEADQQWNRNRDLPRERFAYSPWGCLIALLLVPIYLAVLMVFLGLLFFGLGR